MRVLSSIFRYQYSVAFFLLMLMLLVRCSTPSVSPVPSASAQPVITTTPSPDVTPRSAAVTYTPSLVPPTATSPLTPAPAPSIPVPTPLPTLTAAERQDFVKEMLQTNGGCELPCWWSIMPGETSWQTAKDFFTSQGIQWLYEDELYFDPPVHDRSVQYGVDLFLVQRGGVVQSIDVRSEPFGDPLLNHFAQDWHRYSLDQVLIQYGKPSQIMLQLTPPMEVGSPAGYLLDIFYGRLGIAIRYLGLATYDGTTIQACPVFEQMTGIGLWLDSEKDESALVEHFIAPDEMPYFRSLEAATGMSLQTFYDTYKNPNSQACLEGLPTLP